MADPAADAVRRRGLRRMRALALALLVFAAVVYVADAGPGRLLGLRQRRRRGLDGRRDRRLVRRDRAVPAPARAAGAAHGADPASARTSSAESLEEFVARTSSTRRSSATAWPPPTCRERVGRWLRVPEHRRRVRRRGRPTSPAIGLARLYDDARRDLVEDVLVPRFCEEPIAPAARHPARGIVDERPPPRARRPRPRASCTRWLPRTRTPITEVLGERAPWWAPPWLDDAVIGWSYREAVRWLADIRDDPRHHARQALDSTCCPARATTCSTDPETQASAEALKERLLDPPAGSRDRGLAVERSCAAP